MAAELHVLIPSLWLQLWTKDIICFWKLRHPFVKSSKCSNLQNLRKTSRVHFLSLFFITSEAETQPEEALEGRRSTGPRGSDNDSPAFKKNKV